MSKEVKKIGFLFIVWFGALNFVIAQWTQATLLDGQISCLAKKDSNLFAGSFEGNVFLSSDKGVNWVEVNNGLTGAPILCLGICGTNIFAGTMGDGVFCSNNNGNTWTSANYGISNFTVNALASSNGNIFAGTEGGVFLSTNNGYSWVGINNGMTSSNVFSLAIENTTILSGTGPMGNVFLSGNNGTSWTNISDFDEGMWSLQYFSLAMNGSYYYAGTSEGFFFSANSGLNWTPANTGLGSWYVYSLILDGSNTFAGTATGIFFSPNNGTYWNDISEGFFFTDIRSILICETNILVGTWGEGVWIRPINQILDPVVLSITSSNATCNSICNGVATVAGSGGTPPYSFSWSNGHTNQTITGLCAGNYFVTVTDSVGGYSTASVSINQPQAISLSSVTVDATLGQSNGAAFVDASGGNSPYSYIWNNGQTAPIATGLASGNYAVTVTDASNCSNTLIVTILITSSESFSGPSSFYRLFPNPFTQNFTISYSLSENSFVSLKLFDISGKFISTITFEKQIKGEHNINYDGENMKAGIYYYQLITDEGSNVKKIMKQ